MEEMLNELYHHFYSSPPFEKEQKDIEWCHQQLIKRLGKEERRLVLRIIDRKDSVIETISKDSFIAGLQLGWRLSNELDTHWKTQSDSRK